MNEWHGTSLRIHYQKVLNLARFVRLYESDIGDCGTLCEEQSLKREAFTHTHVSPLQQRSAWSSIWTERDGG
jgi:hypothetical protein